MGTKKSNKLYAAAAALAVTASAVAPGLTADAASKVTVKSVTNPASISHYGGYTFAVKKLSLPKTVKVLLSNKKYENRSVKWGKVSYDKKYIGKYQTISGTVSGTTKKASIKVKLNNYPVDVVEPKLAPVAVGEKLNLPSTIDVKYKDGKVIARSAKSFNLTAEKTDKAGMMKLSYNYMGKNSSIKGSIAYEVKAAEITNVMDSVKEDTLSVSADVKFPAKDAKAQLLIFPGKDESKALPAIDGKLEGGKFTAEGKMIPDGTHSYSIKIGDVVTSAKEFKVDNAAKLVNVSAVSAKSFKIEFNKAVEDTKAKFEVKKGTITANVAKVTFSDDKKSATVELSSKLTKGDYTVNVTGLTTEALTKVVAVEDEKVAKVEVLSENAVLNSDSTVTTGYKVSNQYGEDITKSATGLTVTSNISGTGSSTVASPSTGVVTITNATGSTFKVGDKISLSILDANTSTFTSKVLTVSNKSAVSDISVKGLYNEDTAAVLNTDATATDFHLLVDAKDQYGQEVAFSSIANDVVVTSSDSSVIDVKGGTATPTFEQVTIDGKKQSVLELKAPTGGLKAGKATISIISKTTGKVAQYVVEVKEGVKADAVTLSAPELAVAGEKTEIPFTAFDLDGKEITKASTLNGPKGLTISDNDSNSTVSIVNDTKTGKAKLVLDDTAGSTARKVILTATSANGKVSTLIVDVKAAAEPKVITATKDVVTDLAVGGQFKLNKDTLVLKDQYGRDFDLTGKLSAKAPAVADAGKYLIKVEKSDTLADKVALSTDKLIASNNADVTVTGSKKGSEAIKLSIQKVDNLGVAQTVASSELEVNVKVAEKSDIVSYELKDISSIYDEPTGTVGEGYAKKLVVYGVLADGKKVVLPNTEYAVVTGNEKLVYDKTTSTLDVAVADNIVDQDGKDVAVNVKVIVDSTNGPVVLEKAVTVTTAKPKADSVELKSKNNLKVDGNIVTGSISDVTDAADLKSILYVVDQYGEDISSTADVTLTATNLVNSDKDNTVPVAVNNGSATLSFTGVESGDSYNLTYVIDGKVVTVKVIAD
ncbi:hypothetical protein F8N00_01815 [Exiguobacterium sp. A1_3_1]|uniref:Ig-like domain-containing protein n=1 Tax=Exiguobacterium sp. A1_3_1 TaxID=2651871 RepID=UPI003B897BEC